MLTLITGWALFVSFLHCKVTPLSLLSSLEKVTLWSPHLRSGDICSTSYRVKYRYLEFCTEDLSLLSHLFKLLFYINMNSWIFILCFKLWFNNTLFLLLNITSSLSNIWKLPVSLCIFPAPVVESVISPMSSGPLHWGMVLKIKIWVLRVVLLLACLLPSPPIREIKGIYVKV